MRRNLLVYLQVLLLFFYIINFYNKLIVCLSDNTTLSLTAGMIRDNVDEAMSPRYVFQQDICKVRYRKGFDHIRFILYFSSSDLSVVCFA